jgi:hypothetical protein
VNDRKFPLFVSMIAGLALSGGCAVDDGAEMPDGMSGLSVLSEFALATAASDGADFRISAAGDVASVQYTVTRQPCFPGDPAFVPFSYTENRVLRELGNETYTDLYVVLEPGCYHIDAVPLTIFGNASAECNAASDDVVTTAGQTFELTLLSQCLGEDSSGSDNRLLFNTPPRIIDLDFAPDKYVGLCEGVQTICATAADPQSQAIEFEWITNGTHGVHYLHLGEFQNPPNPDGSITECLQILPLAAPVDLLWSVTVFDLMIHPLTGQLVRVETYLSEINLPAPSRYTLNFPTYQRAC